MSSRIPNTRGLAKRISTIWLLIIAVSLLSFLFPHADVSVPGFVSYALQVLLFVILFFIIRHEPTRKNRLVFVNFLLLFSTSFLFHIYNFLGAELRFLFMLYIFFGGYVFLLSLSIVYLTIDTIFREYKAYQKYLVSIAIVGSFFYFYSAPFLADPKHAHKTESVLNWKELSNARDAYIKEHKAEPSREELTSITELHVYHDEKSIGTYDPVEKVKRVDQLYPYLFGSNFVILVFAPLYENVIYMNVLCLGFIMLFFGYQYKKDPPQGAYIEKIMFLFLVLCTMEIFHAWSFIKSLEWQSFSEIVGIGQFLSAGILLVIVLFFGLRLRFITSANGEYYEVQILDRPTGVTRWRDWLDELVIAHFLDRKTTLGRMFAKPEKD